jgi:hypothetical protein
VRPRSMGESGVFCIFSSVGAGEGDLGGKELSRVGERLERERA